MLQRLRLREFVIVDEAEIVFDAGFSVLTGETGAGKSILLDALGLLMGSRADAGVVREGAARADLSAEFSVDGPIEHWLAEHELTGDPGQLLLRRIVEADGRSKALINGHPATAALLREVGERLIDIHGQHAAQSMLRSDGQRVLLDAFGGLTPDVVKVGELYRLWRELDARLQRALTQDRELALERERIEWRVNELAQLKLEPGEWDELNLEQKRLAHSASLIEGAGGLAAGLAEDEDSLSSRLYTMAQKLKALAAIDPQLQSSLQMLENAQIQVDEAASDLSAYAARIDLDPARLNEIEQRVTLVFNTARKLRLTPDDIPAELANLRAQLDSLMAAQDIDGLRTQAEQARTRYEAAAQALSRARTRVARSLASGVGENIQQLGMAGGRLDVAIESSEPAAHGMDRVEFRIAGHTGATPRPLAKVASGGELSRIGLAIAVLAAQANAVPTLIFDEADAGVGGAVAEVIGHLMRRLGESRQVLCVTHLPQVAARAHQQYAVSKQEAGGVTVSRVQRLDRQARVEEIARMLGGVEITATTRRHAREMLADLPAKARA